MPDAHHRTICVAFGAGIPQDTFGYKPSLFPFHFLCTNNIVKKISWYFVRHSKKKRKIEERHILVDIE